MSTVVAWDRDQLALGLDGLLDVYAEAMVVDPAAASGRRPIVTAHLDRDGLRAVAAHEQGELVGVAYGYLGRPGQWWHDQVRAAMGEDAARDWLDGAFEVCELHVRPGHQGRGLGAALLTDLLDGTGAPTAVLSTPDEETRARGFYRARGWTDLVRRLHFPGDPRAFAVLGLRLQGRALQGRAL